MTLLQPFSIDETHGILHRHKEDCYASSEGLGWKSIFASAQRERPFQGSFEPVRDQLIVWHRNGPARIHGQNGEHLFSEAVPMGGINLLPANANLALHLRDELDTLHVYIRRSVIEYTATELMVANPRDIQIRPMILHSDKVLQSLLSAVYEALGPTQKVAKSNVDFLAMAIAAHLVQNYSNATDLEGYGLHTPGQIISPQIARAIQFMRTRLDQPLGLDEIADAVNWSASNLTREFKRVTGMPPHQYLINLRISRAQDLLSSSDRSIAEIAFECGFSHQEHLSRHFKRLCNLTPGAYRRTHRRKTPSRILPGFQSGPQ